MEQYGKRIEIQGEKKEYKHIQIDKFWTFVKHRKKRKQWLLHAYSAETKQIIAYVYGNRSRQTVQKLYDKLKKYSTEYFCTDNWRAFQEVKHLIGKQYTREIEGIHTSLRARNRRFVRKTTCFSKDFAMHDCMTKIIIYLRNLEKAALFP